mmetsp:Transcript_6983/g.14596  ORF Transcript_6983/g.14596 Transcript_6983/m.14596 type:complete len:120 (-) Transcript_6983:378-737(-)
MNLQHVLDRIPTIVAKAEHKEQVWKQVDLLLRANKANRRVLKSPHLQRKHMPLVLEGAGTQVDVFFHFFSNSANHFPTPVARDPSDSLRRFVPSDRIGTSANSAEPDERRQRSCCPAVA